VQWDVYQKLFAPLIGVPLDSISRMSVGEDELIFVEELYQVLYSTVLYCTVLYHAVLYSAVLYSTILYYIVLYCMSQCHWCTAWHSVTGVQYRMSQCALVYSTACHSVTGVQYCILQCQLCTVLYVLNLLVYRMCLCFGSRCTRVRQPQHLPVAGAAEGGPATRRGRACLQPPLGAAPAGGERGGGTEDPRGLGGGVSRRPGTRRVIVQSAEIEARLRDMFPPSRVIVFNGTLRITQG